MVTSARTPGPEPRNCCIDGRARSSLHRAQLAARPQPDDRATGLSFHHRIRVGAAPSTAATHSKRNAPAQHRHRHRPQRCVYTQTRRSDTASLDRSLETSHQHATRSLSLPVSSTTQTRSSSSSSETREEQVPIHTNTRSFFTASRSPRPLASPRPSFVPLSFAQRRPRPLHLRDSSSRLTAGRVRAQRRLPDLRDVPSETLDAAASQLGRSICLIAIRDNQEQQLQPQRDKFSACREA